LRYFVLLGCNIKFFFIGFNHKEMTLHSKARQR
jgi:hypothetical protein